MCDIAYIIALRTSHEVTRRERDASDRSMEVPVTTRTIPLALVALSLTGCNGAFWGNLVVLAACERGHPLRGSLELLLLGDPPLISPASARFAATIA